MLAITCPQRDARSVSPRPVHPKDHATLLKSKPDVMLWETARPPISLLRLPLDAECSQIVLIEQAGMICGLHAGYGLGLYLDCLQHLYALPKQICKIQSVTEYHIARIMCINIGDVSQVVLIFVWRISPQVLSGKA